MGQKGPAAPLEVKDLLQARILARLFAQEAGRNVVRMALKGGMAMRLAHGSSRHTKDIDLDADVDESKNSRLSIKRNIQRAIEQATSGGWIRDVEITNPVDGEATTRWKVGGVLTQTGLPIHLTVELSHRDKIEAASLTETAIEDMAGGKVKIPVYSATRMFTTKACAAHGRVAPRDTLDLYFLLVRGEVEADATVLLDYINKQQLHHGEPIQTMEQACEQIFDNMNLVDEAQFVEQVLPNWDNKLHITWQDYQDMRTEVQTFLWDLLMEGKTPDPVRPVGMYGHDHHH